MLDNSFQMHYRKLPIATYAIVTPPAEDTTPFMNVHYHRELEVIVIVSGAAEVVIDQNIYRVSKGDIVLIPPYSIHSGDIMPGEGFAHFCFCFDISLLNDEAFSKQVWSGALDVERVIHHSCSDAELLNHIAYEIFQQCERHPTGWEFMVRGELMCLVGRLEYRGSLVSLVKQNEPHSFGVRIMEIIEDKYDTDLTSRDLAQEISYSHSYFCRLFHENFSCNFQTYLRQYRLCKARILLAQRSISVSEAAAKVGFHNLSYFSKCFNELFGYTPKAFQIMKINDGHSETSSSGPLPPSRPQKLMSIVEQQKLMWR